MKNEFKLLLVVFVALGIVCSISNSAFSTLSDNKIAVVDLAKIVKASSEVNALKNEQIRKTNELNNWIDKAQTDVMKQKTVANKEILSKKYENEFETKRKRNQNEYIQKLNSIEKNIILSVNNVAQKDGYNMVFTKQALIFGGEDITNKILQVVK